MRALVTFFTNLVHRYMPDAFVIAIALTLLTTGLAVVAEGVSVAKAVTLWGDGFWSLLSFAMQMAIILISGYVLAKTPLVDRFLDAITSKVTSPRKAIVIATLAGVVGCWFNWGFGLIVGSVVARKLAINVKGLHFPLAIAAAYSGLSIYGIGMSGTVPLLIATDGHFLEGMMGVIPLEETIFSPLLLGTSLFVLITLPIFNMLMHGSSLLLVGNPLFPCRFWSMLSHSINPLDGDQHWINAPSTTRFSGSRRLGLSQTLSLIKARVKS